jgi:hypothetical protein
MSCLCPFNSDRSFRWLVQRFHHIKPGKFLPLLLVSRKCNTSRLPIIPRVSRSSVEFGNRKEQQIQPNRTGKYLRTTGSIKSSRIIFVYILKSSVLYPKLGLFNHTTFGYRTSSLWRDGLFKEPPLRGHSSKVGQPIRFPCSTLPLTSCNNICPATISWGKKAIILASP